jgi:hypothetical protein
VQERKDYDGKLDRRKKDETLKIRIRKVTSDEQERGIQTKGLKHVI